MALPTNRQAGDVISASDINAIATQVNSNQTALGTKLGLSGGTMTGAINMGGNAITNFRSTQTGDPATRNYVSTQVAGRLSTSGGTLSGVLNMGGNQITSLANPTSYYDGANKGYVDSAVSSISVPSHIGTTLVTSTYTRVTGIQSFIDNNTSDPIIVMGNVYPDDASAGVDFKIYDSNDSTNSAYEMKTDGDVSIIPVFYLIPSGKSAYLSLKNSSQSNISGYIYYNSYRLTL